VTLRTQARSLLGHLLVPVWRLLFRIASVRRRSVQDQLDTVLGSGPLARRFCAMQVRSEMESLLTLLAERAPRTVVEIGTARGGTLWLLSRVAAVDALLISVDLPDRDGATGYRAWRERVYRSFGRRAQRISLVRGNSHDASTVEKVRAALDGRQVSLLFVDGDHSYEGVRADWRAYGSLLAPDGLVVFHDIVPGPEEFVGGVPRFWRELRDGRPHREIVDDWGQGGYGLGILLPNRVDEGPGGLNRGAGAPAASPQLSCGA